MIDFCCCCLALLHLIRKKIRHNDDDITWYKIHTPGTRVRLNYFWWPKYGQSLWLGQVVIKNKFDRRLNEYISIGLNLVSSTLPLPHTEISRVTKTSVLKYLEWLNFCTEILCQFWWMKGSSLIKGPSSHLPSRFSRKDCFDLDFIERATLFSFEVSLGWWEIQSRKKLVFLEGGQPTRPGCVWLFCCLVLPK